MYISKVRGQNMVVDYYFFTYDCKIYNLYKNNDLYELRTWHTDQVHGVYHTYTLHQSRYNNITQFFLVLCYYDE